jgi:FAD-linked oxidoreductase
MLSRRAVFLGLGAATLAGGATIAYRLLRGHEPLAPPETDAQGHLLWRNWSGIQNAYPENRWAPASEEELAAAIASQKAPIRAVGAGHSFTALVPTSGTLLTLDRWAGLVSHDAATHRAVLKAGTRLGELGPALANIQQEMPNLPDIDKQSLAGAIATGTHGTGRGFTALHGQVERLRLVTARGEIVDCDASSQPELYHCARVGLGAFGIVTQVELRNRPLTRIRKRTYVTPFENAVVQWPALIEKHRNVEFYAVPFTGLAAVITADETQDPLQPRGPDQDAKTLMDLKKLRDLFGYSNGLRRRVAQSLMKDLPDEVAVDEGWKLLSNERPVRFNEMEFHLPLEMQMSALQDVVTAIEEHRPDVFFPIEVRVIEQDDAWLSPFYGRRSGSIAVHTYYQDEYRFLFDLIEPIFRRYEGRPHWGKLNSLRAADLEALYPRWKDAMTVRESVDPDGRFLNPYLAEVLRAGRAIASG